MAFPGRHSRRRWALWLGSLALLIQLAAGALPMPAAAGTSVPAWLAGSLCRGSDGTPLVPDHPVCPVCFVLAQAGAAVPPTIRVITPPPVATVAGEPRDSILIGMAAERRLPVRGPPAA